MSATEFVLREWRTKMALLEQRNAALERRIEQCTAELQAAKDDLTQRCNVLS